MGSRRETAEFRIWDRALSPAEIRERFDWTFDAGPYPAGLVLCRAGHDRGKLSGKASVVPTLGWPGAENAG